MKGFVIFDTAMGSHVVSSMAEPDFGLSGMSGGGADPIDSDTAATNVAAMTFGLCVNAKEALGAHSSSLESSERLDSEALMAAVSKLVEKGDSTANGTAIPQYDDTIVCLSIFEHAVAPLGCVVVMPTGVAGGSQLAQNLCKQFVLRHGLTYLQARDSGRSKNYRKDFLPVYHEALYEMAVASLDQFVRSVDIHGKRILWSTAFFSPELTVAVETNTLTSEEVANALQDKRPPARKRKKFVRIQGDSPSVSPVQPQGATGLMMLEPVDMKEEVEGTFIKEALRRSCVHTKALSSSGEEEYDEWSDPEGEDGEGDPDKVLSRDEKHYQLFKGRRELLAAAAFIMRGAARTVHQQQGRERAFSQDILVPHAGGKKNGTTTLEGDVTTFVHHHIIISGDFYIILALRGGGEQHQQQSPTSLHSSSIDTSAGDDHLSNLKYHLKAVYRAVVRKD